MSTAAITIIGIIVGIIIVLLLITVHEFGHFLIAKYIAKAYVYEFSIGIGPKILQWGKKETRYTLRLIPLGGYVYIASYEVDPPRGRENEKVPKERLMEMIPYWKRLIFIIAGSLMNFVIAVFLFTTIYSAIEEKPQDLNYWGATYLKDKPAYNSLKQQGVTPNQTFVITQYTLYDDHQKALTKVTLTSGPGSSGSNLHATIPTYYETVENFLKNLKAHSESTTINITFGRVNKYHQWVPIQSDSQKYLLYTPKNTPLDVQKNKTPIVGIFPPNKIFTSTAAAYRAGWKESFTSSLSILKGFGNLLSGNIAQLSGPVGLFKSFGTEAGYGAVSFFLYVALLSANLFVLNLMPVPPLDGYKFWETFISMVIRRDIPERFKIIINLFGILFFATLVTTLTIQDIMR